MLKIYGRESLCDYRKKGETELWGPDFAKMAEGMGCVGVRVDKADEFKGAFEVALASGKPTVISVATEIETPQYRSAWYPYPKNFNETWKAGPIVGQESHAFVMPSFKKAEA
jgi:acetolactate synthase I/II/III large subunit